MSSLHLKHFNRRLILRGLGGAAIAAPFLGSIAERAAKAAGEPAGGAPKRLIVMFTHYGCLTDKWFPNISHGELSEASFAGTSLASLAPFAKKILMPRGIRAMNEWTAGVTTGQGNDPHTQVVGTYFTCVPVTPNTDNAFDLENSAAKFNAKPIGASLDHICAEQVSPKGTPLFLRVSGSGDSPQSAISYTAPATAGTAGTAYTGIANPKQAYQEISNMFQSGGTPTPDDYKTMRGKSVIDIVRGDLETLERMDMSQSDKQKLAAWKELLSSTSNVVVGAMCNEEKAAELGLTDVNYASVVDPSGAVSGTDLKIGDIYSNVAVLAALCDSNRVIFLKYPANFKYKGVLGDSAQDAHNLSHRINGAGMGGACYVDAQGVGVNTMLEAIDKFYADRFAYLVGTLDGIAEGDGKVLDNTATVWFQELSDGNAHNLNNMPIVQAGGCGGYFKLGQAINVDPDTPGKTDMSRGNSVAACENGSGNISFQDVTKTGTDAKIGNAPINKYFCNLMNAIGVKAGPDGFPLKGGTEEVTHYGMYDNTADFVGGGTKPAKINNPGQFTEFLANG